MHLVGVLRADLAEAVGRRRLERPVGLTVLDRGDLRLGRQTEGLGDLVRIPSRLRQLRPLLEVRVALHDQLLVRVVRREVVGARARQGLGSGVGGWAAGRHDRGVRDGELVLELGVRRREVDRHRPGRVVRRDAPLQRAGRRLLETGVRADDAGVEAAGRRALDLEDPLEGGDDVRRRDLLAVRELDPLADLEDIGLAAVRRSRQRCRDVGHDDERGVAACLGEGEQAVVRRLVQLPVLEGVVDLRIERSAGGLRQELQRPTAVRLHRHTRIALLRRGAARVPGGSRQQRDHGSSDENPWYPTHIVS